MNRTDLEHAAELLTRAVANATPGPWRDCTVDGNRYGALISDHRHPHRMLGGGWDYDQGYGGCLVGESHMAGDRRLLAVLRNVADHLPPLLEAIAHEDPIEASRLAHTIATAITDTHRPR